MVRAVNSLVFDRTASAASVARGQAALVPHKGPRSARPRRSCGAASYENGGRNCPAIVTVSRPQGVGLC